MQLLSIPIEQIPNQLVIIKNSRNDVLFWQYQTGATFALAFEDTSAVYSFLSSHNFFIDDIRLEDVTFNDLRDECKRLSFHGILAYTNDEEKPIIHYVN